MDFQYVFRQAHRDRLEEAGVMQRQPVDDFGILRASRTPRRVIIWQAHRVYAALLNLLAK